jgi:ribonuclease-3
MLAAIYLDSRPEHGIAEIERIIILLFHEQIESAGLDTSHTDDKTALQELVQKMFHDNVIYRVAHEDGPDHDKRFEVAVTFQNREFGRGKGKSKKSAEQDAARKAILALQKSSKGAL